VQLLDLTTGESRRLGRYAGGAIAFSSNDGLVAVAGRDDAGHLWLPDGEHHLALRGHANGVEAIAFAGDGLTIATASHDRTVRLWDITTGQQRAILAGHTDSVLCLAFSPDGGTLVSGSQDGTVRFWRAANNEEVVAWFTPDSPRVDPSHTESDFVERALKEIRHLNGRVITDDQNPDNPVIGVYLTGHEVTDATIQLLSPLRDLRSLSLFNTNVTGEGLKHLCECERFEELVLIGTAVTDEGLAQVGQLSKLRSLRVGAGIQLHERSGVGSPTVVTFDPITDSGLTHFVDLHNLQHLTFDNTQITDDGLKILEDLQNLQTLQFFRTDGVTDVRLNVLGESLPNCEIGKYDTSNGHGD